MKSTYGIAVALALFTVYALMGTSDYDEQIRAEHQKADMIADAKARRTELIKQNKLIDDANYMIYPVAQMEHVK